MVCRFPFTMNQRIMKNEKKILVAVDGSAYSSNALDYLIRLFAADEQVAIHLLSVVSAGGGERNWMMEVDSLRPLPPQAVKRKRIATRYLKDAAARLLRNGFAEQRVSYGVEVAAGPSVGAAIHSMARAGLYDALLIGRRGIGKVGEMFFGSVSAHLFEKCHEVPLWIIDGEVTSTNFLIGVHHTPQSLLAVDHLAFMLRNHPEVTIYLYHSDILLGKKPSPRPREFYAVWGEDWCREHLDFDNHLFHAHARILIDNGIRAAQIKRLPVHRGMDAGRHLLQQAKKHHCGTIIIGRRGKDMVTGWQRRVSDSTVRRARNVAIWIVN